MQLTGTVVFWRDDKGFGFVLCQQDQQKYFFHIRDKASGTANGAARPLAGDKLSFTLGKDRRGRPVADNWLLSATSAEREKPSSHNQTNQAQNAEQIVQASQFALFFRLTFLAAVIIALLYGKLIFILPLLYAEASLMTYWLYKTDKEAAIAGHGNRLAEESLQLFALIGGWPGAYVAQRTLAHKRSKLSFRREFGFVIIGNAMLVSWLLSPWGQAFLNRIALWAG